MREPDRPVVVGDGRVELLALLVGLTAPLQRPGILGIELDRPGEVGDGLGELVSRLATQRYPALRNRRRFWGSLPDGFVEVGDGLFAYSLTSAQAVPRS